MDASCRPHPPTPPRQARRLSRTAQTPTRSAHLRTRQPHTPPTRQLAGWQCKNVQARIYRNSSDTMLTTVGRGAQRGSPDCGRPDRRPIGQQFAGNVTKKLRLPSNARAACTTKTNKKSARLRGGLTRSGRTRSNRGGFTRSRHTRSNWSGLTRSGGARI